MMSVKTRNMMSKIYLSLFALFISISMNAQEAVPAEQANALYQTGKFKEAAEAYENILNTGKESSELYYNLGNAYYKTGNVPAAILNYERALLLSPADSDIKYNLEMSRKLVVDKIEALPEFFLNKWVNTVIMMLSSDSWAWFSIITFAVMLILFVFFLFSSTVSIKKLSFTLAIIMLLMSTATFTFAYSQKQKLQNRDKAIIFAPSVTIKGSPDESGTDLFLLHEGTKVKVLETLGEWANIQLSDGNEGWVEQTAFKII